MENETLKSEYIPLIFQFRGVKVMVDHDLALLYGISTKRLKEQVKRNLSRFPDDFMFELSQIEKAELVANCDRLVSLKHSSVNPLVFTEQGVAMLSSVIHSETAIQINIGIMRAFAQYRGLLKETMELKDEISRLDLKINDVFKFLLDKIDGMHNLSPVQRKKIGYEIPGQK
jgi:hypothetical protein